MATAQDFAKSNGITPLPFTVTATLYTGSGDLKGASMMNTHASAASVVQITDNGALLAIFSLNAQESVRDIFTPGIYFGTNLSVAVSGGTISGVVYA